MITEKCNNIGGKANIQFMLIGYLIETKEHNLVPDSVCIVGTSVLIIGTPLCINEGGGGDRGGRGR